MIARNFQRKTNKDIFNIETEIKVNGTAYLDSGRLIKFFRSHIYPLTVRNFFLIRNKLKTYIFINIFKISNLALSNLFSVPFKEERSMFKSQQYH